MKNYIEGADKFLVDNLKYDDTKNAKLLDVSDKITIGWKGVLAKPAANSSKATQIELLKMSEITKNRTSEQEDLVMMVDDDPNHVFTKMIKKHGLYNPVEEFKKAWALTMPIIRNLKWQFNRARPYQLAEAYGVEIKVLETPTHHTPSYPSGHTAWAATMGYILSDMYPEHSSEIFYQVNRAGMGRVYQGVHYPSDNDASMTITGAIWQDIKHDILGGA